MWGDKLSFHQYKSNNTGLQLLDIYQQ